MSETQSVPIHATGLRKSFGEHTVLDGVDLSVEKGSMLALLGPNGAGKTTTVRILSTLLPFDGGAATVAGFDVACQQDEIRGVIGITGQYASVDEILTGHENLVMIGRLYHLGKAFAKRRAAELLEQFDLVDAATRAVKTYSGGMRRRLDLAASLIADPPIIFLDEPTSGLDPRSRQGMWDVIGRLLDGGTTILLTTQYLQEADQLADRVAVIDRGRVIAEGTADELKRRVGAERLDLSFESAPDVQAAVAVVSGESVQVDDQNRKISLAVGGPEDVRRVLNALHQEAVKVTAVGLSRPTLDDVFFSVTGTNHDERNEGVDAA